MAPMIMLVDDDDSLRSGLSAVLGSWGYSVVQAYDGEHALTELRRLQTLGLRPDLVITDLQMPGLPGGDLCRTIKAGQKTSDIPVMLISCAAEIRDRAKSSGADAYLSKPFDLDDLYARVSVLMERSNWRNKAAYQTEPVPVYA